MRRVLFRSASVASLAFIAVGCASPRGPAFVMEHRERVETDQCGRGRRIEERYERNVSPVVPAPAVVTPPAFPN